MGYFILIVSLWTLYLIAYYRFSRSWKGHLNRAKRICFVLFKLCIGRHFLVRRAECKLLKFDVVKYEPLELPKGKLFFLDLIYKNDNT